MESLQENAIQSLPAEIVAVIEAVEAVQLCEEWEAQKRIPEPMRAHSFFGEFDIWLYMTIEPADDRICFACTVLDKMTFTGLELRTAFPWLEIIDINIIRAKVHPNCRCTLVRITNPLDYIKLAW